MRDALPHASFIGFTGTPIEKSDANTRAVFGDYISVYDIQRAVTDGATVLLAPNAKWRGRVVPKAKDEPVEGAGEAEEGDSRHRIAWARLLKRVFDIDIEHCPHCGGQLKITAAIEDPATIGKIRRHLGPPARAPPRAPAQYSATSGAWGNSSDQCDAAVPCSGLIDSTLETIGADYTRADGGDCVERAFR